MTRVLAFCVAILLIPPAASAADRMTTETFVSGGQTRTYYLLVPATARKAGAAPLLVLLHGSGCDGRSLLEKWEPQAKKEGIVLAGPNALSSAGWRVPEDGPEFLYDLIEMVALQLDVDPRRVYVFGAHGLRHRVGATVQCEDVCRLRGSSAIPCGAANQPRRATGGRKAAGRES